jgi:hypothetical protein
MLLVSKPLGQYRPSIECLYQQQASSPPAAASDVTPSETVWWYVHYKTLIPKIRLLLWTTPANTYWTTAKLIIFASVSPICPRCGQNTETIVRALIDCQSVRPFCVNVPSFISDQVDPMPDVDVMFHHRLSADIHTHRSTKPVLLTLACGLWVVHCARIRRIYTDTSPSVHSLMTEWCSMIKEIVNAKRRTNIIFGNLTRFLPIWRILTALWM